MDTLNTPTSQRFWYAVLLVGLGVVLFLLLYRLADYPTPWYDEGSHLHVAKNYALNGIYADYSSEGPRYYGPAVGVGPTVMLPIALLFRIGGVSIPLARLVIVVYSLFSLGLLVMVGRQIGGLSLGVVAALLLVLAPGADFVFNSRTVLGELPGLFFLLAGLWLWLRTETPRLPALVGVGLLMGLAAITKNQYALFVLPGLLLCWIADLVWYRQRGWLYFVVPGIIAGLIFFAWTFIVLVALGGGDFSENMTTLRTASSGAFFLFGMEEIQRAIRLLVDETVYASLFIPALLYALYLSLPRTREAQRWGMLVIFTLTATGLFLSSLAWARYAFPAIAIGSLFVARLLHDLTDGFRLPDFRAVTPASAGRILGLGLLLVLIVLPLYNQFTVIRRDGSGDAYVMADYLNENIPASALIETWEQELGVLTDHNYHYPPQVVLAYAVDEAWRGGQPAHELYDFRDMVEAEYVVVGEFAKYTNIYPLDRLDDYQLVFSQGAYDLYRLE